MKTSLTLTAVAVFIAGAVAVSAVPVESHRGDPGKPKPCFIDENKDGVCDHAQAGVATGKWQKDEKASTNWNCPRGAGKGRGWVMKGDKIYPNLPDGGNGAWGGATK